MKPNDGARWRKGKTLDNDRDLLTAEKGDEDVAEKSNEYLKNSSSERKPFILHGM